MLKFLKKYGPNGHFYRLIHRIFGVWASNIELYKLALVHRSASVDIGGGQSINNERLEFLGDSVLQLIVSELLFVSYPDIHEGHLSRYRSRVVCRRTINELASSLELKRELFSATITSPDALGDAFEALCGALYLDCGFDRASELVLRLLGKHLDLESVLHEDIDYKSRVLEWGQHHGRKITFEYNVCHDGFICKVLVGGVVMGKGRSRTKKKAEQDACSVVISHLF